MQPCVCTSFLMPAMDRKPIAWVRIVPFALSAYSRPCRGLLIVKEKHYVHR